MRTLPVFRALTLCLLILCTPVQTLAHRVNIFAYVDGPDIVVECAYSKSKRVNAGTIQVFALKNGECLLQGVTDAQGQLRFPVPQAARDNASDLRILLQAGEGHQNEWIVPAAEFTSPSAPPAPTAAAPTVPDPVPRALSEALTRAEMETLLNAALDAKLAPIKKALLEQTETGPSLRDIIGGIGWIFGLVGVAALVKSSRRV